MLKTEYNRMNEKINPDDTLRACVMKKIAPRQGKKFRPAAAIAVVLIVVLMAFPVMAAYVPAINELMFQVSPEMAARFTPIQERDTRNGICMEVVSASVHGATAEVCISFEDLEEDRINGNIFTGGEQLLGKNSFLNGSWGGGIGHFSFDEETGKAIMVIEENNSFWSNRKNRYLTAKELYGGKITVQVDYLYVPGEKEDGQYYEQIVARGPWRVTFPITESSYVGEHDDGVPMVTELWE